MRARSGHLEVCTRRVCSVVGVAVVLTVFSVIPVVAASSPYPAQLTMQRGLTLSATGRALRWGVQLTAAQSRWVTIKSSGPTDRWGVWQAKGGPAQFPVRSIDGGAHWAAAGPQLASDWAGGSLYYITKVIGGGSSTVVMVSNAIIDVTTDGGRLWYQYLHTDANWSITAHVVSGGEMGLRIGPAKGAALPKASYALYGLDVARHRWYRTAQSLR